MKSGGKEYDLVEFVAEVDRVNVVTFEIGKHYNLDALSEARRLKRTWRRLTTKTMPKSKAAAYNTAKRKSQPVMIFS
jgi:hypothetical protein